MRGRSGVRGAACSEFADRAPHPSPLPASRGEGARAPCFRGWQTLFAALFVFITLALPVSAQSFPALSGRVVDDAQVLSTETRNALTAQLAALEARNTDQVVVATVQSLQGNTVEDCCLFRRWGLQPGRQELASCC